MNNKVLQFPIHFLWGASTSAYQTEGGITNDWSEWEKSEVRSKKLEKKGKDKNDFICGQGCDSYNRYEEDFALAKSLNMNAIRFGIEWARLEPEPGKFKQKEIEHYKKVIAAAKKQELKVVLTLWHWTNPLWLAREGGWSNPRAADYFARYVALAAREFGSQVDYWLTLNEPMVHITNGYLNGKFPPNQKSLLKARKVFNNLTKAHQKAYRAIRRENSRAQISLTQLMNYFAPARRWCPVERLIAGLADYFWNKRFLRKVKKYLDFIAVDYYFHDRIVWHPPFKKNLNKKVSDLGWEIYPAGIFPVLKSLKKYNKPILVVENGLADKEDKYRTEFIKEHLYYIRQAIEVGVDVRGYFHWSLLDNFEWAEGWKPKFGLFEVDRKTFERKVRPSARAYAEICRRNKLVVNNH